MSANKLVARGQFTSTLVATMSMRQVVSIRKEADKLEKQNTPHGCAKFFDKSHAQSIARHMENGTADKEIYHALLDADGKKLKFKALTMKDAFRRNVNLRGTGFSWSRCSPERKA